jgi:thiol-disulfide isomerase/thioredoxin
MGDLLDGSAALGIHLNYRTSMQSFQIDRLLKTGILVLTAGFIYTVYASLHEHVVVEGESAPSFTLTADNGRSVSLPNFGGKLLVLNFWASWCPPCVEETPSLSRFSQDFAPQGVVVLGVSVDKDDNAYRKFLQRFRPAFLTVRDAKVHQEYGTFMYPETYIIDAQGKVRVKIAAAANWNDPKVIQIITSLLNPTA